jgi:hypothetical protein
MVTHVYNPNTKKHRKNDLECGIHHEILSQKTKSDKTGQDRTKRLERNKNKGIII